MSGSRSVRCFRYSPFLERNVWLTRYFAGITIPLLFTKDKLQRKANSSGEEFVKLGTSCLTFEQLIRRADDTKVIKIFGNFMEVLLEVSF